MITPVFRESVRLADLPRVAVSVRTVLTLHECRVDRPADARHPQGCHYSRHRAEDYPRDDLHHTALLTGLLHDSIVEVLRRDLIRGFGTPPLAGTRRRDRL